MLEVRRAVLRAGAAALKRIDRRAASVDHVRRVLVCANGGLGNLVLLLPLLRGLRGELPQARIDLLLTNRAAADLARESRWVDDVIYLPEEKLYSGLSVIGVFAGSIRSKRYDMVLRTFLTAPYMARASLASLLSGARLRVAYGDSGTNAFETHVIDLDEGRTEVDRHLALARVLGLPVASKWEGMAAPERGRSWSADFFASRGWNGGERILGLHPGSDPNYRAKRWPAERFGELAARAGRALGLRPLVIGGADDLDAVGRVVASAGPGAFQAMGQDIVQTAGLIERCAGFVSNDSGLMHLASALDVPTVALFGPTDPVKNRPLGGKTVVVRLGLECSPCNRETATSLCAHRDCLMTLGVEPVLDALEGLLSETGGIPCR